MNLFPEVPSSPLSDVPSDFERSAAPSPVKRVNVTRKRKVVDSAPVNTRSTRNTRRKTGDAFPVQLEDVLTESTLPEANGADASGVAAQNDGVDAESHDATLVTDLSSAVDTAHGAGHDANEMLTGMIATATTDVPELFADGLDMAAAHSKNASEVVQHSANQENLIDKGGLQPETSTEAGGDDVIVARLEPVDVQGTSTLAQNPAVLQKPLISDLPQHGEASEQAEAAAAPVIAPNDPEIAPESTAIPTPDRESEDELAADELSASLTTKAPPSAQAPAEEQTSTSRPSRRRVAPTKLSDEQPTPTKTPATTSKRKSQPLRGNWTAEHLLTNPKSKLATCNLSALLSQDRAWTLLDRTDQLDLISMLPSFIRADYPTSFPNDTEIPNILRQVMKSNSSFRADVRLFQEDLAAGRYEPQWQQDAQEAMEQRAAGVFDAWKEQNREEFWGQKQKVNLAALSGDSAQYSLVDLAVAGLFEIGDVWALRVSRSGMVVEKEAKIIDITPDHTLSFSFPPGRHKFSADANGKDVVVENIKAPKTLCDLILKEDGRLASVRVANAWKDFRCMRRQQDMGSLFDVRELYCSRQS